jgi:hypothetical protein
LAFASGWPRILTVNVKSKTAPRHVQTRSIRAGLMGAINGNIGAIGEFAVTVIFSSQPPAAKQ